MNLLSLKLFLEALKVGLEGICLISKIWRKGLLNLIEFFQQIRVQGLQHIISRVVFDIMGVIFDEFRSLSFFQCQLFGRILNFVSFLLHVT